MISVAAASPPGKASIGAVVGSVDMSICDQNTCFGMPLRSIEDACAVDIDLWRRVRTHCWNDDSLTQYSIRKTRSGEARRRNATAPSRSRIERLRFLGQVNDPNANQPGAALLAMDIVSYSADGKRLTTGGDYWSAWLRGRTATGVFVQSNARIVDVQPGIL